jgi:hypothetical protein
MFVAALHYARARRDVAESRTDSYRKHLTAEEESKTARKVAKNSRLLRGASRTPARNERTVGP